jgi:predicted nucleotidyltransferase
MKKHKLKEELIKEIVNRIVSVSEPEKIILFGSYVYGTPDSDSDIDILVVKRGIESKIKEYTKIRKGLMGMGFPFDIILLTPEEYEFYSTKWKNSILAEIREKSAVVHGI